MSTMDEEVRKALEFGNRDSVFTVTSKKTGKKATIAFARADMGDWERIKDMETGELKCRYISLLATMKHCFSIRDLQLADLMERELYRRDA